ncbi:hypothetical protein [Tenacibaculum soleae]|uniref:Uncharacterized protein n=1 Tax=Tenacibaculum soleae TaxID=447689 RepID=A0A1B9Y262_9FLAO|nr:hypothetical protein [Tenacibaculum soleae]MDO6812792.1 hypothetical protein [Tenacibaculum soleae]OCK43907.1 hypothetical protein BA195_04210 [Tenacibaculum soleae]
MNNKILTLLTAAISLIGAALFVNVVRIDKENVEAVSDAVSPLVTYSYYLLIGIVIVAVVISLLSMFKNPAALKKTVLGVAALGVIFAVCYMLSSNGNVIGADGAELVGEGSISKWVGTGISFSMTLGAVASVFFVVDLLKGIVKS